MSRISWAFACLQVACIRKWAPTTRLLSLGPSSYLEVIAIDPAAPPPGRTRWFDLDRFAGPPKLTNWVVRCDDLVSALAVAPAGTGKIMQLARGDLHWRMAVPDDGCLPFDGGYPGLISWRGTAHPAAGLPDRGARLELLEIVHPKADMLRGYLKVQMNLGNIRISNGAAAKIVAHIRTASGVNLLC